MDKKKLTKSSISERIAALESQSLQLREAIDLDFEETKKRAIDIGKMALIVGGGVVLSLLIYKSLFGHRDEEEQTTERPRVYHRFRDQIGSELSNRAALFFLGLAQDKLRSFLQPNAEQNDNPASTPRE